MIKATAIRSFFRGDWQVNNQNNVTWLFLNSIAKLQIPTRPDLTPNDTIVDLIRATIQVLSRLDPNMWMNTKRKQSIFHVWSGGMIGIGTSFFSLAGYFQHSRATFETDPFNVLSYTKILTNPFRQEIRTGGPILEGYALITAIV